MWLVGFYIVFSSDYYILRVKFKFVSSVVLIFENFIDFVGL